ncbi:PIN domain-like protein, partial [Mycena galericulata]
IQAAAEQHHFLQLTVDGATDNIQAECRPMILGVDASIWMYQAERAARHRHVVQAGANPAVRILFYKLAYLLSLPLRVVFVFDGPERPELKRGARVLAKDHHLNIPFQELILAFGYHFYMAPGEAEADLARLNQTGIIDFVQTVDSDVFVFGAPRVLVIPKKKEDAKNVNLYTLENLFINPDVSLTRGGFLLIALLAGGDYHKVYGVKGCGMGIAHAISRSDLGDALLQATLQYSHPTNSLADFLVSWREALCLEFATDPHGYLGRKHPAIAANIKGDPSFPDIDVLFAYVHPTTSWSDGHQIPDHDSWGVAEPHAAVIADLCRSYFGWEENLILAKLGNLVYQGIALQSLLRVRGFLSPLPHPLTIHLAYSPAISGRE